VVTPKAKLGTWKPQTRLSIQQLPSLDAQIVEQQEERLDKPKNKSLSPRKAGKFTFNFFYLRILYVFSVVVSVVLL